MENRNISEEKLADKNIKTYSTRENPGNTGERPYSESERKDWKQLYNEFFSDFTRLLKKESELIRTELGEKTTTLKSGAYSVTVGSIVAFVGVQAIAATGIILLGQVMPWWLSAFLVGIVMIVIGMSMMARAKKKFSAENLRPEHTMESLDHFEKMFKEKKDEFKQKH